MFIVLTIDKIITNKNRQQYIDEYANIDTSEYISQVPTIICL